MALTRIERNQIYEAIAASSLIPAGCHLGQDGDIVTITHTDSGSTFKFYPVLVGTDRDYRVEYKVIDGHEYAYLTARKVENLTDYITHWGDEVRQITDAPDLWAEMRGRREFIEDMQGDSGNAPFTQDEQKQIAAQLQEIKKQIRARFELTSEQIAQVDEKLDEAAEASTRMGRKDWLLLFSGVIFTLIITATVTPGIGEHIFTMVIHGLAHLFTGGSEPPQIPPRIIA